MQPEELSEGDVDINEEGGFDEKDEDVPEVLYWQELSRLRTSEMFCDVESSEGECSKPM